VALVGTLTRASQSASAGILAQIARESLGCRPAAQIIDLLVFHSRSAIERILEPFQLRLQMLHARLERLHALLPTRVW
jgi:hypothetical protein